MKVPAGTFEVGCLRTSVFQCREVQLALRGNYQQALSVNPVSAKQPHVFRTELDFTHLFFENNMDEQSKKRFSFSPHFSLEHQVAFSHNFLPLKNELKGNSIEEKCFNILYHI